MKTTTPGEVVTLQPTADQALRLARLRRFNSLFIYLPIAVLATLLLVLIVWILWRATVVGAPAARTTNGAIADIILMMTLCPLMLLCAIGPGAAVALIVRSRRGSEAMAPRPRPEGVDWLQAQLWRLDNLIVTLAERITAVTNAAAAPLIALRTRLAFVETWIQALWERLQRPWGNHSD